MFIIYFCTIFHIPSSNGSLILNIRQFKENFHTTDTLLFYILEEATHKSAVFCGDLLLFLSVIRILQIRASPRTSANWEAEVQLHAF
jgi:hypothetical protein